MAYKYIKYDLGYVNAGEIIEISTKYNDTNAFLVDQTNFDKFNKNRSFNYFGGQMNISPLVYQIPKSSNWYVINKEYVRLRERAKIKIQLLKESKRMSLTPLFSLIPEIKSDKKHDVFISYNENDFDETIAEFIQLLEKKGLRVLNMNIDEKTSKIGLKTMFANARLGIIIPSVKYFLKNKNLITEELNLNLDAHKNVILPLWHRTSKNEMLSFNNLLENNICRNTFSHDLEDITSEISEILL
jgi:hypothetical protein